jgi:hypothetical protein
VTEFPFLANTLVKEKAMLLEPEMVKVMVEE